ncbi:BtrH N-terminal domain-containing protein [Kribbella sp. NPDC048915]|uniref:BtrH N-terminal domain-containing protein n=1 Tax=Kribbella sp. NPDC048915 TaxID=3155148 RepID=UPI0033D19E08
MRVQEVMLVEAGEHCETTALGVLLRHQGIELSEAMIFGLGSGLSFVYWDSKSFDFPFLGGRVKPFELARNLAARLGLELDVRETSSPAKAWANVAASVDAGTPVGLQLDSYYLDYFTSKVHFGGHIVAMIGYDANVARLADTRAQGGAVTTSLAGLAAARAARGPMTARHRSFTITAPHGLPPVEERVVPAIIACAQAFLHPPIANLGYRGIEKASKLVPTWIERSTDPQRDLPQAALLMEKAGTGGALFRNLYRDFLGECTRLVDNADLRTAHALYGEAAALWTEVAALITRAGESEDPQCLAKAADQLHDIAQLEHDAMTKLSRLAG